MPSYEIQVLDKSDFSKQFIVSLSSSDGLAPLKPSSVRVRSEVFALTVNTATYAKLADVFGWWNVHPLPPNMPSDFNDAARYGRTSAWGFGCVIESTYDGLPVDSFVFGYLPIGTLPVDLQLGPRESDSHPVMEISPWRAQLLPLYNRYVTYVPAGAAKLSKDYLGWNSVFSVLFFTTWRMSRFVLAWDERLLLAPSSRVGSWSISQANIAGAVVIALSGSSKTALPLPWFLKHDRPNESQPSFVIGVTSKASQSFTEKTGFYDQVLEYGAAAAGELANLPAINKETKVVLMDFGGRGDSFQQWYDALNLISNNVVSIIVGSALKVMSEKDTAQMFQHSASIGAVRLNSNDVMIAAIELLGEEKYKQSCEEVWNRFFDAGGVPGMLLEWGEGMDAVKNTWEAICSDQIDARKGYVLHV
jgi:hypothetical protein